MHSGSSGAPDGIRHLRRRGAIGFALLGRAVPRLGDVGTQAGVGWSYGGLLIDHLVASDSRFKVAGNGNQLSLFSADRRAVQYERQMRLPWPQRERRLQVSSPFFKVEGIKTPTLFPGGRKGFNMPIAGSEQM